MEVKLAHPYKTRAIAEARIKNDRLDAKICSSVERTLYQEVMYLLRK